MEQKLQELDAEKTEAEQIAAEEINDLKAEGQKVAKVDFNLLKKIFFRIGRLRQQNSYDCRFVYRLILY